MCDHSKIELKRRLLLQALAVGGLLSFPVSGAPRSIYRLQGSVLVDGRLANPQTLIRLGDNIETAQNSNIIFVVGQDAYYLWSNSRLSLVAKDSFIGTLRLFSGKLLSVFGSSQKVANAIGYERHSWDRDLYDRSANRILFLYLLW